MTAGNKLWRNRKERKDWARRLRSENPGLEVVHPHTAGIDVGNSAHYVAVRPDRDPESCLRHSPTCSCLLASIPTRGNERQCRQPSGPTQESVSAMNKNVWRAVIEVAFIIFLFYSNLLMGEFERSGMGQKRGVAWAIGEVLTAANFGIAMIAALIGYVFFEFLRKKF
jgi:hypothetical protein